MTTTAPRLFGPPAVRDLSSHEVIALAGISYRQLDYWTRVGYIDVPVVAPGQGTQRRWTAPEAAQVLVLARVASLTRDLEVAARVARLARQHFEHHTVEGRSVVVYATGEVLVVHRSELTAALLGEPLGLVVHLAGLLRAVDDRFALAAG